MKSVTLELSVAQLSDLFFNYEHPHLDEVYKRYANQKDGPSSDELSAATIADAESFVGLYNIPVEPLDMARDFENRA